MSFIRTEDKKKHHARKLPDGSFEFDGKKEEVGGGGGGSTVTWTSSTVSTPRKKIGAISIDGVSTDVYAPNPSIPKQILTQCYNDNLHSDNINFYPILDGSVLRRDFTKCEIEFVFPNLASSNGVNVELYDEDDGNRIFLAFPQSDAWVVKYTLLKNDDNYTIYGQTLSDVVGTLVLDEDENICIKNIDLDQGTTTSTKAPHLYFKVVADEETNFVMNVAVYKEARTPVTTDLGD